MEGLTRCTECHVLGEKVTNEKCLDCHIEIQNLIQLNQGFHASTEMDGKACITCHSEHHGRDFEMARFNQEQFNHALTGFELEGRHSLITCKDCHKKEFIHQEISQKKTGNTFLGLERKCLTCHEDYHQQTLSDECSSCHNLNSFNPATKFDHQQADFQLEGKHQQVDCNKCHMKEERNGKAFQQFTNVEFNNCTACHKDVHENRFGQDCRKCHTVESFLQVSSLPDFDHNQTNFPLKGKHQKVNCKTCHEQSYAKSMAHNQCNDCHQDYHQGQFIQNNTQPDCYSCHSVNGFKPSGYTIERHNQSNFKLTGAHLATPCFMCHQKTDRWEFKDFGSRCVDCHQDIHKGQISKKFMPKQQCELCHSVNQWDEVHFDHHQTNFELKGKHAQTDCRSCHFEKGEVLVQHFSGLSERCESCHSDVHRGQFQKNGVTSCERCHSFEHWEAVGFDHSQTRFILEGAHTKVDCQKCHPPVSDPTGTYIRYKLFNEIKCANCHSS
ncbi:hypothetical protein [Sunxiuqinia sp. sy24]|uniref:hypothetical protein n=1 Tax=Sunxiuqinia sp. sy24 TaxID=3461495 RepID=UPI0040460A73